MTATDIQTTANADGYTLTVKAGDECIHRVTAKHSNEWLVDEEAEDYNPQNVPDEIRSLIFFAEETLLVIASELRRLQS